MEMHAVPRDEVHELVSQAGGTIIDCREVFHCGPR